MPVEMTAMKNVFQSQCGNVVFSKRSRKCSSVGLSVQNGALFTARHERYSSASGRMAVMSIQEKGNRVPITNTVSGMQKYTHRFHRRSMTTYAPPHRLRNRSWTQ